MKIGLCHFAPLCAAWFSAMAIAATDYELPRDHADWPLAVFNAAYRLVATPQELDMLDTIPRSQLAPFLNRFWKRRDPTPTTDTNEFKSQIESRVNWALAHYRTVGGSSPWDERGDVYIRLGPPDEMQDSVAGWYQPADSLKARAVKSRTTPGRKFAIDETGMARWLRNPQFNEYGEVWYYFQRNLQIQFQGWKMEYRRVPHVSSQGEYQSLPDFEADRREVDSTLAVYRAPENVRYTTLAVDAYAFRRPDNSYDLYVVDAVPLGRLSFSEGVFGGRVAFKAAARVFDSALNCVWADSSTISRAYQGRENEQLIVQVWYAALNPGAYIIAMELVDSSQSRQNVGTCDKLLVPFADSVALDLSPLVIAESVTSSHDESRSGIVRNDHVITPMPGRVFRLGQPVYFYHEVYNIEIDSVKHEGRYEVQYALYGRRKYRQVLASRVVTTEGSDTFQTGKIPSDILRRGEYILEVKTTDLSSGVTRTALSGFVVQ